MAVGFLIILVIILAVVLLARRPDPVQGARILKRIGFGVVAFITALFGLFLAGETFTDPGGWKAIGLIAAWAIPLAALAALAWYRPGWAARLFAVLVAAVIGLSGWFAADPQGWRAVEDQHGPIRAIISFVLAAAVAPLGLKRTAQAGVLLLVLGVVPVVVSSLGSQLGFPSLAVVSSAPLIAGVLYLCSAAVARRGVPPDGAHAGADRRPKAA